MKEIKLLIIAMLGIVMLFGSCNNQPEIADTEMSYTVDELVDQAKAKIVEIDIPEFKKLYDEGEYYLIDVRDKGEHNNAYIPGSINISRGLLEFKIEKESFWEESGFYLPLKEELIIVYCKKGSRAALAAEALQKMGYLNVKSIKGGFQAWKDKNPSLIETNAASSDEHGAPAAEEGGC